MCIYAPIVSWFETRTQLTLFARHCARYITCILNVVVLFLCSFCLKPLLSKLPLSNNKTLRTPSLKLSNTLSLKCKSCPPCLPSPTESMANSILLNSHLNLIVYLFINTACNTLVVKVFLKPALEFHLEWSNPCTLACSQVSTPFPKDTSPIPNNNLSNKVNLNPCQHSLAILSLPRDLSSPPSLLTL